jgi:hypothetical protein
VFELIDVNPGVIVQESEYRRLLGYPADYVPNGPARELAGWARQWYREHGKPWVYARQIDRLETEGDSLQIGPRRFSSQQLREQWIAAHAHSAVLVAVSAGIGCEEMAGQLWREGKPDEYFFLETYGSAVVEALVVAAGGRICAWAEGQGMAALPHYSPGYSGRDISDQAGLFDLIRGGTDCDLPSSLRVLESGMLQPKKSLLAVIGITRSVDTVRSLARLIPCETCSLPGCAYRRVPYRRPLPRLEDVRRLQPLREGRGPGELVALPAPTSPPPYSVNARALRKWSRERLKLLFAPDGSVDARFRYEGTTCSNLGRPLEFDYQVRLQPSSEGYQIVETRCVPAPGDTGHTCMCEYLADAQSLMRSIAAEHPLSGRPLDEVLTWERPASPAGCYCDAAGRRHKWGLVLEVIHYALGQVAKEPAGIIYEKTV